MTDTVLTSHLWMDRIEVERCVVGWLFLHPEAIALAERLSPEHFQGCYPYGEIYRAILATQPIVDDVNFMVVVETLRAAGSLDAVGGPGAVAATIDNLPANFDFSGATDLLIRADNRSRWSLVN